MCAGICQIRQAKEHQFGDWDWAKLGHGHYCVSSYGLVLSHSDDSVNFTQKSFRFRAGDVLHFEYDSQMSKLKVATDDYGKQY